MTFPILGHTFPIFLVESGKQAMKAEEISEKKYDKQFSKHVGMLLRI